MKDKYFDMPSQLSFPIYNPLCDAAMPLFGLILDLRKEAPADIAQLYQCACTLITEIMECVHPLDYDTGTLKAYSYSLCVLMDECVMGTEWGRYSTWSQRSLLSAFHQETWGGEKFFTVLARMTTDAQAYQHPLEFMYLCLCMGLKGKYGNQAKGEEELQKLITKLHRLLRPLRGETSMQVMDAMTHVAPRNYRLSRQWPVWTPWAIAVVVLAAAYTFYAVRLHAITQEVLISLDGVLKL